MATLPTTWVEPNLDADDGTVHAFGESSQVYSYALDNMPTDFQSMDTLSWTVEYFFNKTTGMDDEWAIGVRVVGPLSVILAAATSGGAYATVKANGTPQSDEASPGKVVSASFAYVDTSAIKSTWDSATLQINITYTRNMGSDSNFVAFDYAKFDGTYSTAGITVNVGQATETDTSNAVSRSKVKSVGQSTETDLAQSVTATSGPIEVQVGQALETDTSNAVAWSKVLAVGQASESSAAQPVTWSKTLGIGQAAEVDSATTTSWGKADNYDVFFDLNEAQPVSWSKVMPVGQAQETDQALGIVQAQTIAVGQASETSTAQTVAFTHSARQVGLSSEVDSGFAVQATKTVTVGQVTEADAAFAVQAIQPVIVNVGQALESSTSQTITWSKADNYTVFFDLNEAQPVAWVKTMHVGQAAESDTAFPTTSNQNITVVVGQATETETAQPVGRDKSSTYTALFDLNEAQPVTVAKRLAVGQATEASTAQPVNPVKVVALAIAIETNDAFPLTGQPITVGQAVETDQALAVTVPVTRLVGMAVETDAALSVIWPGPDVELRADALTLTTQVHDLHLSVEAPGLELSPELYLDTTPDSEHLLNVLMRTSGVQSDTDLGPPFLDALIGTLTKR